MIPYPVAGIIGAVIATKVSLRGPGTGGLLGRAPSPSRAELHASCAKAVDGRQKIVRTDLTHPIQHPHTDGRHPVPAGGRELRCVREGLPPARPGLSVVVGDGRICNVLRVRVGMFIDRIGLSHLCTCELKQIAIPSHSPPHPTQAGQQPSTVGVDLFSMETQEKFLVWMNLGYLVITCALYLFMRRREVRSFFLGVPAA